ncbi:MAG: hypothetical protein Q8N81_02960, partial [bacterium]|nr:hypothetical protein [bacterium]
AASLEQAMEKNSAWTLNPKRLRFLCGALYNPEGDTGLVSDLSAPAKKEIGQLLSDIDLNFGIWSIELKKYADGPTQYLCDVHLRDSEEYDRIVSSAKHLVGRLQALARDLSQVELSGPASFAVAQIRQSAERAREFLLEPRPDCVYWFDIFTNTLKLKRQARVDDLKKFAGFGKVVFFGALGAPEVREYFLRVFRLPQAEAIECRFFSPKVRLGLNTDLPTKDTPYAYQAMIETLGKILSKLPGRTVALVNSQKNLDNIYEPLSRLNLKSRLLVQRYTGHYWKNLETYGQEKQAVWFLTVKNFLSNVQKLPPTTNLIILRIPYDAPGVMSGLFDQDSVFLEYILPRTAIRLQQILRRVAPGQVPGQGKQGEILRQVIFLDPRMLEEYNSTLLGAVEAELDCERIEFDSEEWQIVAED